MISAALESEALLSKPGSSRKWILPGFIALSIGAHALTFFLFQIEYPGRVTISAPAPTVSLLDPARPDHQALLRLVEEEDPAPTVAAQGTVPAHLLEVPYRPSYATSRTALQTLPEPPTTVQFPPARDPLAVIRSGTTDRPAAAPRSAPSATRLLPGAPLADRSLTRPLNVTLAKPETEPLLPARFLIAVTARGDVRFSFLQSSSGDPLADAAAAAALDHAAFSPTETPITWSPVTISWGEDIYRARLPESP